MANKDAPFGLRPLGCCKRVRPYYIPSGYATALFIGDPVVKTGTANTTTVSVPGVGIKQPGTMPAINKAAAGDGNAITGVIVGFAARPDALGTQYSPASTEGVAFVADHPDDRFVIQADGTLAETSIGLNAVLIYTNAGSTSTGLSGAELDTASDVPAADASNQLTIEALLDAPDNEMGEFSRVVVKINQHTEADNVVGL